MESHPHNLNTCATCKFAVSVPEGIECRRYAPRPHAAEIEWNWPLTDAEEWCGEFRPNAIFFNIYDLTLQ